MKIAIFMSTFNGEKYLDKQLNSIYNQKVNGEIIIYIRDDGSTDNTISIIRTWAMKMNIILYQGENLGPAKSFWRLFTTKEIMADYYAFCDQDDIWDPEKLQKGITVLQTAKGESLWCSNCRIIDQNDNVVSDRMNDVIPDFSIISQFVCGTTQGCAMLLNDKLRSCLLEKNISSVPMHDFTIITYAIAIGKIFYDNNPTFGYRIHNENVIANEGKTFIGHMSSSINRWFSNKHRNELSSFAENFLKDNMSYLDKKTINYLNNLFRSRKSIVCRFKIIFNPETKSLNKRAEWSFKIRVALGII